MEGQLPEALGRLHAQLRKTLEDEQVDEVARLEASSLANELENLASIVDQGSLRGFGPTENIKTYSLGPAPTHCGACGRPFKRNK